MIIAIIVLSILFAAAALMAVLGWHGCYLIDKDLKAAESLLDECEKVLADAKEKINKKIGYIDPNTILMGTAICNITYNSETLSEIIDLSQYADKGLFGVTLLTPDPPPPWSDPAAEPVIYEHSIVYKGPHGGWTWKSGTPYFG